VLVDPDDVAALTGQVDRARHHPEVVGEGAVGAVGGGDDDVEGEERPAAHDGAALEERHLPRPLAELGLLAADDRGGGTGHEEGEDADGDGGGEAAHGVFHVGRRSDVPVSGRRRG
jgi:hypothetical protein